MLHHTIGFLTLNRRSESLLINPEKNGGFERTREQPAENLFFWGPPILIIAFMKAAKWYQQPFRGGSTPENQSGSSRHHWTVRIRRQPGA